MGPPMSDVFGSIEVGWDPREGRDVFGSMEVGWDPVLVTVTFLDQWRSVGLVFQGGFMVFMVFGWFQ